MIYGVKRNVMFDSASCGAIWWFCESYPFKCKKGPLWGPLWLVFWDDLEEVVDGFYSFSDPFDYGDSH